MDFSEDAEPPTKKPPKWKNCCAAILTQKVAIYLANSNIRTYTAKKDVFAFVPSTLNV